ncbi:hypothetical protein CC1G_02388 [Coprinopsis cinerea okayama7|uniref:Uncharacterized protein n=1 Tax=Coprinopsis cinerea (strain Okayama-7 / 130 / ATCC MYA-4618 / FGSC 9003) TaxID=240176 RepID=A8N7Y1_COPC7|nr:hypothetical protein CC1G_02388 [Coprinopsis cinerea okayama7\|eukprot:XP_001830937.1 hypothetical protein CC1G_02388 [Coprinopsis cinerea okayama7\
MKFTLAPAAVFFLATSAVAGRAYRRSFDFDDELALAAREVEIADYLEARLADFIDDIYERTGPFMSMNAAQKKDASKFIKDAHKGGKLSIAAAPGSSQKTVLTKGNWHLDRQQSSNANREYKVAVQKAGQRGKGESTTAAQVKMAGFPNNKQPNSSKVHNKLQHSLKKGKETQINYPSRKQAAHQERMAKQQAAKKAKAAKNHATGTARAKSGIFRKGKK